MPRGQDGGRQGVAATILVLVGVALIIVPTAELMSSLGDSVHQLNIDVSLCDRGQLERMFRKCFDDVDAAARFAATVPADRWAPTQVQEWLLKAANVDEALARSRRAPAAEGEVALLRAA